MLYCSLLYIMNQNAHARRVMTTNNHYEVLGVARNASSKDIKKAYREMALIYHPDKNSNPGAKEVFNKLVNSYNVLSNDDQRRIHDDQLARPKQAQQYQPPRQQQPQKNTQKSASFYTSHYYDHEHSNQRQMPRRSKPNNQDQTQPKPKESNDDPTNKYKRAYTYMPRDNSPYTNQEYTKPKYRASYSHKKSNNNFIILIALFCMVLFYFFPPFVGFKDPLFVLTQSERYNVKLKTKTLKVTYFVKSDYEPSPKVSDQTIESLYLQKIQRQCDKSLKTKKMIERLIKRATSEAQVTTFMDSISRIDLKPCKKIIKLIKQHPNIKLTIFTNNIVDL